MITRIQLYKLDDATAAEPARSRAAADLLRALGAVAGARRVEVGLPADPASAKSWDLSLVLAFDDLGAADAFLASDAYREALAGALGPSVVVEKGWSFAPLPA